jgi:Zn-finger nucleic acid-binding protein
MMNCPNCGAAMRLNDEADYLICDYCQTPHFPDPNSDGVRVLGISSDFPCPLCAVPLTHASIVRERIFYCERCRGMLIGMGIFPEIVQDLRSRREATVAAAHPPNWDDLKRRIQCPRCRATMDTHPYCGPGNIIIDTCENCALNWLDYSELDRVVRAPDPEVPHDALTPKNQDG